MSGRVGTQNAERSNESVRIKMVLHMLRESVGRTTAETSLSLRVTMTWYW